MALISWKEKFIARWKVALAFFNPKGIFLYTKVPQGQMKVFFMLVFLFNLDLIISRETIHKWENFTSRANIYNLIYKWSGIVVLRIGFV